MTHIFKEGDIVLLKRPWLNAKNQETQYVIQKNNGPATRLVMGEIEFIQPDIWTLEAITGDCIGSREYSTIYHMLRVTSPVPGYIRTLPPI